MFRRLMGPSEIEQLFSTCKIDKTHDMISPKPLIELAKKCMKSGSEQQTQKVNININIHNNINNQINININGASQKGRKRSENEKKKDEIVKIIFKKIRGSSQVQRIKALVLVHAIIRKTYNQEFMEIVAEEVEKYIVDYVHLETEGVKTKSKTQINLQEDQHKFIQKNVVSFYCQYLTKLIINIEHFRFAQKFISTIDKSGPSTLQLINIGFIILNLCNFILQSQFTFNKMGRYYIQYKQIISLFIMYLNDLIVYNTYIKQLSKLSLKRIKQSTHEQAKHHFLFVTQSQKTSDRFYQFFYNRYYYTQVKKLIMMPNFLTISSDQYKDLAHFVKNNDPELVKLVKNSKYQTRSRSKTNISEISNKTIDLNQTQILKKNQHEFMDFMFYVKDNDALREQFGEVIKKISIKPVQ